MKLVPYLKTDMKIVISFEGRYETYNNKVYEELVSVIGSKVDTIQLFKIHNNWTPTYLRVNLPPIGIKPALWRV